ncbi:Zinc metalloproteinase nas-13 [Frankliniella fusca]|uniref:Metalloendopeptidase n=1 Tax=Frankliniella fusca TaxID=407009 RepID=A0AAE1H536_9NEOP|nr:Zinc metalloproteinase nas-13 [Frankliniella fusca]
MRLIGERYSPPVLPRPTMSSSVMIVVVVLATSHWSTLDAYPVPADGLAFWKMVTSLGASIYGTPSEVTGELLKKYTPDSGVNPEELGEYTQGDILFTSKGAAGSAFARNGLKAPSARWPGAVVPFEISYGFRRNNNFDKADASMTDGQGVNYDYRSVMHYSAKAFSKDGSDTITARAYRGELGQREGFSEGDIRKLQSMYKCVGGKTMLQD